MALPVQTPPSSAPPPPPPPQETADIERALKRRSGDIGWEYGELYDESNKDKVKCVLCGKKFSGGVYRIKQHVAGMGNTVKNCPNSSEEDIQKCKTALEQAQDKKTQKKIRKRKRSAEDQINIEIGRLERQSERYRKLYETECERNHVVLEENKLLKNKNKNVQTQVRLLLENHGGREEGEGGGEIGRLERQNERYRKMYETECERSHVVLEENELLKNENKKLQTQLRMLLEKQGGREEGQGVGEEDKGQNDDSDGDDDENSGEVWTQWC